MWIVGRRASLRQRGEQNEAGDTIGTIHGEFDACRSALGRAEEHDPAAADGIKHGADVLRGRVNAGRDPDPVGKPDATAIEQDETTHLSEGGQERPAPGLLPNSFDVRHETGEHQNINATGAVGLEREMYATAADIARRRRVLDPRRRASDQQRAGLGFRRHVKLVAKSLRQGLEMALGSSPISGEQEIADEVPTVHFAEGIEFDEPAGMRGCGRVVAGRILLVHHPLERLYRPAPQRLFPKEGPLIELRAVVTREAGKKITQIETAGLLKLAAVAGLLEQLRIDLQVD